MLKYDLLRILLESQIIQGFMGSVGVLKGLGAVNTGQKISNVGRMIDPINVSSKLMAKAVDPFRKVGTKLIAAG